ncbi:MAG: class I SAM-dependent methyltransferase [Bacteroidota bacterium]|nr:class I SAM-dependent methyltransferase [Bacteroidota bacterium]
MKITDASIFIHKAFQQDAAVERWADLGCGSGTFTYVLANNLKHGSTIYAVDKVMPRLTSTNDVEIKNTKANIENIAFATKELDGILMANSLHYIKDKSKLIKTLTSFLKVNGKFLIVEYDTNKANRWVPFPLPFDELPLLFRNSGFSIIDKIGERSSIFGPQKMYACLIKL